MYTENKIKFKLGNIETEWVENNVGVRQGCVISPTLFNIFMEELIARIRRLGGGVKIGGIKIGALGYADDLVVLTNTVEEMIRVLEVLDQYGKEWDVKFSGGKCKIMECTDVDRRNQWVLGDDILEIVNKYKYLGVEIRKGDGKLKGMIRNNESKAGKVAGLIRNTTWRCSNKYEVGRVLWKGVGVPRCLYGAEVLGFTQAEVNKLEKVQRQVGRLSLGAKKYTANEAIGGELGWSTMDERIAKIKIGYEVKIKGLEENRWLKKVYEE
ncbi:unnamed protein product, partial [Rotaria magnacalcarata]